MHVGGIVKKGKYFLLAGRGQLITLTGRFYTAELQNQEDSDVEFFNRILVGGVSCDFVDENGTA